MLLPVFDRPTFTFDRGQGCYLWDTAGRRYLDFLTGIGVNALGHAHPRITRVIQDQAARCLHTSNLFHHSYQQPLARRLAEWSGLSHTFFTNSGSEAMEVALKTARAFGAKRDPGKFRLVALEHGFHGRTMGALSVTSRTRYRTPFGPLLPGVTFVRANAIEDLRAAVDDETCAIITETIQGEGGVQMVAEPFLREVRRLADSHDALWIADEIQCGLGRTGTRFAFQHFNGPQPDIVVVAKPLAAGIPLAATMFSEKAAAAVGRGEHGTTFGGGPLACRVALEVLDLIDELLPQINRTGVYLHQRLGQLQAASEGIVEVRGAGLMAGIQLAASGDAIAQTALERGLVLHCTHGSVLRMLPPFIATPGEVEEAMEVLESLLARAADRRPRTARVA